jgi:membrane protein DedA with SNARE-associated domain
MDQIVLWKYVGVFTALLASGFGFPIPEEIPIVTAGAMVGHDAQGPPLEGIGAVAGPNIAAVVDDWPEHRARWWIMIPVCILGVVIGDACLYGIGRRYGTGLLEKNWVKRWLVGADQRAKIEENFHKYGIMILLGARLTPGIRTPVFMMSGILRVPLSHFILADGLYAIPGVNILFWLSYFLTDQFVAVVQRVEKHRPMVIVAILSAVAGIIVWKFLSNWRVVTGETEKVPKIIVKPVESLTHVLENAIDRVAHVGHGSTPDLPPPQPKVPVEANGMPAPDEVKKPTPG